MPRGGYRPNAGRPRTSLADLVVSGGFNYESRAHRRALFEQDLPDSVANYDDLWRAQTSYRNLTELGSRDAKHFAKVFADGVNN
jgi:hypothetical protein